MTSAVLNEPYAVHELLTSTDPLTSCEESMLHGGEIKGRDIRCDDDGFWRRFLHSPFGQVDAGSIKHRAACIGYVFTTEHSINHLSQKVVVLGDTHDPYAIAPLALGADLLVHEATDASIPISIDPKAKEKRTPAFVEAQTKQRGHSTPDMAGEFAKSIDAKHLVLNHIGARFPPAKDSNTRKSHIIQEIERQAATASGLPQNAVQAAYDFLVVRVDVNSDDLGTSKRKKRRERENDRNAQGKQRKRAKY